MRRQRFMFLHNFAQGVALLIIATVAVEGAEFRALYHNIASEAGHLVPDLAGTAFNPGTSSLNFRNVYASGENSWIMQARTAAPISQVLIANDGLIAQEGAAVPFAPGQSYGPVEQHYAINTTGTVAFRTNTSGGSDTADEYMLKSQGGIVSIVAQEGMSIPAISGAFYGESLTSPSILSDGTVGLIAQAITGSVTPQNNSIAVLGNTLIARTGVTVPSGQVAGGTETLSIINNLYFNADGSNYILKGVLNGPSATDEVVVIGGNVVLQRGATELPGLFTSVQQLSGTPAMNSAGDWMMSGRNSDTQDWVIRNGVVVASEGNLVTPSGSEVWIGPPSGSPFSRYAQNDVGDFVISGFDNFGNNSGGVQVLVLNGTDVIARNGDPVDLDGNGLFDDDAFFSNFTGLAITNAQTVYLMSIIRNGSGTNIGSGLFATHLVPEPMSVALLLVGVASIYIGRWRRSRS